MSEPYWSDGERTIYHGDNREVLPLLDSDSFACCVTDPPYSLSFMGKAWDRALPPTETWRGVLRVLKPGGFLLSFMTPRLDCLWRFAASLDEAGFDIGYSPIWWVTAQGFPKGQSVSAACDKAAGVDRPILGYHHRADDFTGHTRTVAQDTEGTGYGSIAQRLAPITEPQTPLAQKWDGWRTGHQALKPATEVVIVAQKPMEKGAQWRNVVKHGVGGFNVKGAAVPFDGSPENIGWHLRGVRHPSTGTALVGSVYGSLNAQCSVRGAGRYPSNLAVSGEALGPKLSRYWSIDAWAREHVTECEDGLVAYCPKASRGEKEEGLGGERLRPSNKIGQRKNNGSGGLLNGTGETLPMRNCHPTAKPVALVAWLLTLICPPDGLALDCFMGQGTTLAAAKQLGLRAIGIELNDTEDEPYCRIARKRVEATKASERTLFEAAGV